MKCRHVHNLSNRWIVVYLGLDARNAVRSAYAQYTKGDWNTWEYEKYDSLIEENKDSYSCGDWYCLK